MLRTFDGAKTKHALHAVQGVLRKGTAHKTYELPCRAREDLAPLKLPEAAHLSSTAGPYKPVVCVCARLA